MCADFPQDPITNSAI